VPDLQSHREEGRPPSNLTLDLVQERVSFLEDIDGWICHEHHPVTYPSGFNVEKDMPEISNRVTDIVGDRRLPQGQRHRLANYQNVDVADSGLKMTSFWRKIVLYAKERQTNQTYVLFFDFLSSPFASYFDFVVRRVLECITSSSPSSSPATAVSASASSLSVYSSPFSHTLSSFHNLYTVAFTWNLASLVVSYIFPI
jgi:hypothetical protein